MSSVHRDGFTSSFPIWMHSLSLSLSLSHFFIVTDRSPNCLGRASSNMLSRVARVGTLIRSLILRDTPSLLLLLLSIPLAWVFCRCFFIRLKKFPPVPNLLSIFYHERVLVFNFFSEPIVR